MDDQDAGQDSGGEELVSRPPENEDFLDLCRRFNEAGARYLVVGGFAIRAAGYDRRTMDIDFIIDTSPENEARVFKALESLPDQAVKELDPGDTARFSVVRVADEILVDLMASACGIDYAQAEDVRRQNKVRMSPFFVGRAAAVAFVQIRGR